MSVMLTKFESKSNRVKGVFDAICSRPLLTALLQDSRSTRPNRCSRLHYITGACSYGTTGWVFWWIGLRNMRVREVLLFSEAESLTMR